tara:strand:- start:2118 stop:2432 length:315 start_codon:yes stop_codon:yes gene_type:complete
MSNYKLLYVICGSKSESIKLAKMLVKNKLAACTNIIDNIYSIFNWNNKVKSSKEYILIGKTQKKKIKLIIKTIKKEHSYSCPCILFLNIDDGYKNFLKWIKNNS